MINFRVITKRCLVLAFSLSALLLSTSFALNGEFLIQKRPQSVITFEKEMVFPGIGSAKISRHHIVPYSVLRDFYNAVIRRSEARPDHLRIFAEGLLHITLAGSHQYLNRGIINEAALNNATDLLISITNGIDIHRGFFTIAQLEAIRDVQTMFIWMPGNIFIGPEPRRRFDDPGRGLESSVVNIVGIENYDLLQSLYFKMLSYINNPSVVDQVDNLRGIVEIIGKLPSNIFVSNYINWFVIGAQPRLSLNWCDAWAQMELLEVDGPENRRQKRDENRKITFAKLSSLSDPFCLNSWNMTRLNLVFAEKLVNDFKNSHRFERSPYNSWKHYYASKTWTRLTYDGLCMSVYTNGLVFKDGSFAVGLVGSENKYEDNWTKMVGSFKSIYRGQMFFDKNGRPVAVIISDNIHADWGSGWSFVYNHGMWEYESTDDWDERRFHGRTESLDSDAPTFSI